MDLKTGHGGMIDVEFFVQASILKHAGSHPEILIRNTLDALAVLHAADLIDTKTYETLDSGYTFLISLEDRLRIMEHRSVDRLPLEGEKLKGVARRLGYGEGQEETLLEDYRRITKSIRKIYREMFSQP